MKLFVFNSKVDFVVINLHDDLFGTDFISTLNMMHICDIFLSINVYFTYTIAIKNTDALK